jgi:hypothetical protein
MFLEGLTPSKLAKLGHDGLGNSDRIYFYDDMSNPEISKTNMDEYLKKLRILIGLQVKDN